jgi:isopenicillin-N N-acyltransferase-like protein
MIAEHGGRAMDVEVVPGADFDIVEMGRGAHVHTNNILSERLLPQEKAPLVDSQRRLDRARSLAASAMGTINVETAKKMLQDHDGSPTSICRHGGTQDSQTIFSIIARPEVGVAHIAVGNPCSNPYRVYEIFTERH